MEREPNFEIDAEDFASRVRRNLRNLYGKEITDKTLTLEVLRECQQHARDEVMMENNRMLRFLCGFKDE